MGCRRPRTGRVSASRRDDHTPRSVGVTIGNWWKQARSQTPAPIFNSTEFKIHTEGFSRADSNHGSKYAVGASPAIPTLSHPVRYCPRRPRMEVSRDVQRREGRCDRAVRTSAMLSSIKPMRGKELGSLIAETGKHGAGARAMDSPTFPPTALGIQEVKGLRDPAGEKRLRG